MIRQFSVPEAFSVLAKVVACISFAGAGLGFNSVSPVFASQVIEDYPTSDDLDAIDPNMVSLKAPVASSNGLAADALTRAGAGNNDMAIATVQVLLDREGFSPGAINGMHSEHFDRIVRLYEQRTGKAGLVERAEEIFKTLAGNDGAAFVGYTLTTSDITGPFLSKLPKRIQDQRGLKKLNFLTVEEAIAERFHMDEAFLKFLNPDADFSKAGTVLKVANVGKPLDKWVASIRASKKLKQVTAYDETGVILGVYPASIGSRETPSPEGVFTVRNKAGFPAYTLAPDNGFEPLDDDRAIVIAPGPNNPVGSAWIGLSERTYGIHGTPEPSTIGSAESHGCIRLTNWDAMELARLVRTGVTVVID